MSVVLSSRYLLKLSKVGNHWSKRYFVLTNDMFMYFRDKAVSLLVGVVCTIDGLP